jgi:ABC-type phosphate transport system substrate-binding protein
MTFLSARRLVCACALFGAIATALVVPGLASAEPGGEQCSGENIEGKGASLQKLSQIETWNPAFNTSANALGCNGTQGSKGTPTVKYTSTGSGAFLRSWGQEPKEASEVNFGPKNAYGGTDEPPNAAQKTEMESHSTGTKGKLLQTIPVEQAAVTIAVHLPKGCKVEKAPGSDPGRLALKEASVEKVFRGEIVEWKKILNKAKLVKSGSEACESSASIKRVVRKDGSGTTSLFKKYLWVVFKKEVEPGKTWKTLAESANNTTWPKEAEHPVLRGEGNGGVASEVAATASSIGYINLADARANGSFTPPTGGTGTATFWAEVENGKITVEGKKVATYADPSTDGDVAAKANSNCEETNYTNGKRKFPPESTAEPWNEVTTSKTEPNYVICGFTYDLGLEHMGTFTLGTKEAPTSGALRTAFDYYNFVLADGAEGGQTLIGENKDYLGLPSAIKTIARAGIKRLSF